MLETVVACRSFAPFLAIALAVVFAVPSLADGPPPKRPVKMVRFAVLVLPEGEASVMLRPRELLDLRVSAGVAVYPESRRTEDFWRQVAAGAPLRAGRQQSRSGDAACALPTLIRRNKLTFQLGTVTGAPSEGAAALRDAFCSVVSGLVEEDLGDSNVVGIAVPSAQEALRLLGMLVDSRSRFLSDDAVVLVAGVAPRLPLTVAFLTDDREGVLEEGIARRPGIVTPYDLSATIVQRLGFAKPAGFIGRTLHVHPQPDPVIGALAISRRLERDADYGPAVAGATIGVLFGGGIALPGVLLLLSLAGLGWLTRFSLRAALGGALAVAGYVASLFVPTANAGLRSIPIVAAYLIGFAWPPGDAATARRRIGAALGITALGIAALTIAAAVRPGGEPALSLWGNPLVSWRLFGLRNHLTSMLSLGVLLGIATGMRKPSPRANAILSVAGIFVVGAAFLGANFVAVLTLTFGAALVTWILVENRIRPTSIAVSALIAVLAFALALLADVGSPVSHGGRAARAVQSEGVSAAWDLVRVRWDLNVDLIGSLWGGWVWTALLFAGLGTILVWAVRDRSLENGTRAALFGGSAAALAALVMEDTGFLAGGIIALAPGLVAATVLAGRIRPVLATGAGEPETAPR